VTFCFVVCVVDLASLFFVAPFTLLAVFTGWDTPSGMPFNQDVSKWNTGAVTTMEWSKFTLSPSPWPRRLPLWCVVEYIRQLEVRRVTISLTRFVLSLCGLKRTRLCSSCSVCLCTCVQSGRVQMEYGGGDNYVLE